jgi:nicotinate dehydrogenase subunit A
MSLSLTVNGVLHTVEADPSTPLLYVLRNELGLNGAKYGCGLAQCGACTVQIDGEPAFSCVTPVGHLPGRRIRTIEGLGTPQNPNPLQAAFEAEQAAQCGYCIAGMIMRAQALLEHNTSPSDAEIRAYLQPNLCRCGTHMRILRAVQRAALTLRSASDSSQSATAAGRTDSPTGLPPR